MDIGIIQHKSNYSPITYGEYTLGYVDYDHYNIKITMTNQEIKEEFGITAKELAKEIVAELNYDELTENSYWVSWKLAKPIQKPIYRDKTIPKLFKAPNWDI